jgi:DNA-binding transcriptional LysR family regulator
VGALYHLRTFQEVAGRRSFTAAGRALGLSQPAVSAHIRALERHFGCTLFELRQRRVALTTEGETLRAYTDRIFNLLADAERAVAASGGLEGASLHVAASATVAAHVLPGALRVLSERHPGLRLSVFVGSTPQVVAMVLAERAHVGLVEAPVDDSGLEVRALGRDELVLIVPPGHVWAAKKSVGADELRGARVLRRERGSATRAFIDLALARAGAPVQTPMEIGSWEALRAAVAAGIGPAWVPRSAAAADLAAGVVVGVETRDVELSRTLYRISRRGGRLTPAAEALLDALPLPSPPARSRTQPAARIRAAARSTRSRGGESPAGRARGPAHRQGSAKERSSSRR